VVATEPLGREPEPTTIVINCQLIRTAEAGGERGFDGGKQHEQVECADPLMLLAAVPKRST
jgi:hypothetical protein